ncbi:hypothetical protein ACQQ2N_14290 [Dokdonella sp. MW10]|uniref:hypothetical protein n=1 Tax=Dokdonella sp. MW10 TaxID=2992926 RepID=UPI003F7FF94B
MRAATVHALLILVVVSTNFGGSPAFAGESIYLGVKRSALPEGYDLEPQGGRGCYYYSALIGGVDYSLAFSGPGGDDVLLEYSFDLKGVSQQGVLAIMRAALGKPSWGSGDRYEWKHPEVEADLIFRRDAVAFSFSGKSGCGQKDW